MDPYAASASGSSHPTTPTESLSPADPLIVEVHHDPPYGEYIGHCKWFNNKLGYGFIRVCTGDLKGTDIFVHHSGLKPLNSSFKTMYKGEYIQFNVIDGRNGKQAVDITGVLGGPLMCDSNTSRGSFLPYMT
jgi:CspA family cold shock protein